MPGGGAALPAKCLIVPKTHSIMFDCVSSMNGSVVLLFSFVLCLFFILFYFVISFWEGMPLVLSS